MKTLHVLFFSLLVLVFTQAVNAQTKTSTFKVSGECGMCKKSIETAAKKAGATYALWNETSKSLTVKYSGSSNEAKIQQSIAAIGYDTPSYKSTEEAYNKLHECCKYERAVAKASCCDGATCSKEECKKCCADGKCTFANADCCTDGKCTKEAHSAQNGTTPMACCAKS